MRKLIFCLSLTSGLVQAAPAIESESVVLQPSANHAFQEFDNQFYLGFGTSYGNLTNGYGQNSNYGTTLIGLGVERLFDIGLWARMDATLMAGYSNFNSSNANAVTGPLGQDPSVSGLNLKVGYAFPLIKDQLLLTPYALAGRNTNLTSNSLNNNQTTSGGVNNLATNVTQDYFLSAGVGGRLEYRLDKTFDFYFDQAAVYNSDRSGPTSSYTSATNYQLVSTLGARFNVWESLQLGVLGFYNYSQLSGAPSAAQQYQLYPANQVGGMATIGLTY